jgi:hypothetical protein
MEWPKLGPQLLSGIARHPESFFVSHFRPALGLRSRL